MINLELFNRIEIKQIGLLCLILIILDIIWYSISHEYYDKLIISIQNSRSNNYIGLIIYYIILSGGIYNFVINENRKIHDTLLLGLYIFSLNNFNNYSLFRNYNLKFVLVDSMKNSLLMVISYYLYNNLNSVLIQS